MPNQKDSPPEIEGLEIGERLGGGGMSMLWKAQQTSLNRTVVVKMLSTDLSRGLEDINQFKFEAQVAANLKHHGIVQVYDFGQSKSDGRYYFIMEYISGYSVGDWVRRKGFIDEENAMLVTQSVAESLHYAWNKGKIVHCDIKPDNIMIDGDGTVKLTDMGLAHAVGNVKDVRNEDGEVMVMGTPNYMAPEQVRGELNMDCRTDIYALGATLYHLVTGVLPFEEYEGSRAMEEQIRGFLQDPRQINLKVRYPVARLIEKMMMKDASKRPKDWQEVIDDLALVQNGKLPIGNLPGPTESTVVIDHLKEQARLAALLPVEKEEPPAQIPRPALKKVTLVNPLDSGPRPLPKPLPKPSPKPSPTPINVPPPPPGPDAAPKPALKMRAPTPSAAPAQPIQPKQKPKDPSQHPRGGKGCLAAIGRLISTIFSMGLFLVVVYVTYNQFIRKPRKDVITPARTWLLEKYDIGKSWVEDWLAREQGEDEDEEEDGAPARPVSEYEPDRAPAPEPEYEFEIDASSEQAVRMEDSPAYQKLLSQFEAKKPKIHDKVSLRLRNRPEVMKGVISDISDKTVTLKVDEGYVDCPFNLLEDSDRLRFFPEENARALYLKKLRGN